ncbi:site-2 protease family protein [Acaryochloris sp. IP29b_bin.137]|uniref:site-2 protease family protein n=1 Tax=Acaryochloris sp. IP29b_bin.137 TaxID=2969217 RepID=UPI0026243ADE|nr:site-2 protease family protein [Acaryochloris sp. IP29b_bin.137]
MSIREFVFLIFIGIIAGLVLPELNLSLPLLHLFAFYVCLYLDIYIHEFGHALAGMSVGFPIRKISIGTGKPILKTKIGQMLFIITDGLGGGLTYMGEVPRKYLKPKYMVFILGGVLAQAIVVGLVLLYLKVTGNAIYTLNRMTLAHVFLYSNILLIIGNLIPYNANLGGMSYPSDGMQLLRTPFAQEKDIQDILATGKILEGYELYEAKKYSEAESIFRQCVTSFPDSLVALINLGASLIKQMKLVDAQSVLEEAVARHPKSPYLFLLNNNLAWTFFLQLTPHSLQQADTYSIQAYQQNSALPVVLNTRGCVLIEQGQLEEGIQLLTRFTKLRRPINDKTNPAAGFIYLAYGYFLNNDRERSYQYLTKVEAIEQDLAPDYQVLLQHAILKTDNFGREL